jgi:pimeloyl-ACP methyl ester carboxylesterase
MTTYVLVAGAWLGGWSWRPVTDELRRHGHDVHPVTLTGLGDRAHLATPEVDLDTYLADVVDLVESEDLHDLVLVGHSYAGHVVTGVADRIPERVSLLAYLDAGPSPDGAAFLDLQPPPGQGADRAPGRGGRRGLADPHALLGGARGRHGRQPRRPR